MFASIINKMERTYSFFIFKNVVIDVIKWHNPSFMMYEINFGQTITCLEPIVVANFCNEMNGGLNN